MLRFFIFLLISSSFSVTWAATVTKIKDDKVVLTFDTGETYEKGQKIKVMNEAGKTVALGIVTAVKGNKAAAKIAKGKAKEGQQVVLMKPLAAPSNKKPTSTRQFIGAVAGLSKDSADVTIDGTTTKVSLTGMGFSAKAFYDMPLSQMFGLRLMAGGQKFAVSGSNSACTGSCQVSVAYLTADAWGRILFANSGFTPWVGVGFSFLYPLTKTSTALDEGSIKMTSLLSFGGGADWHLSSTEQIPVQLEYGTFPSSSGVKATVMAVRAGYSWAY